MAVNAVPIVYDLMGNPTSYLGNALAWNGRQLASYNGIVYTYDASGLRTSKTTGGVTTNYVWRYGELVGQYDSDDNVMKFFYGGDGVVGFQYNNNSYFYLKNLQGDVQWFYNHKRNVWVDCSGWITTKKYVNRNKKILNYDFFKNPRVQCSNFLGAMYLSGFYSNKNPQKAKFNFSSNTIISYIGLFY